MALFSWSGVSGWSLLVAMLGDVGHNFGDLTDFWRQVATFLPTCCRKDAKDEPRSASWFHLGRVLVSFWSPGRVRPGLAWNGKSEKGKQPLAKKSPKQYKKCIEKLKKIITKSFPNLSKIMLLAALGCYCDVLGWLGSVLARCWRILA